MKRAYTTSEIKKKLLPIFKSNPINKAILFGSYANGTARVNSDIDILIDSGGKIKGIDFFGILGDISETLNIDVDLFETYELIEGGKIQKEIASTGVVIYERA